jgi:hypothetical protein
MSVDILGLGAPHATVLWDFVKLTKSPNDFLRGKAHQYHSGEAKRMHVPSTSIEKTTFAVAGFEPRTFWSRESDVPTRAMCSHNLKQMVSSEFIYNKT